MSSSDPRGRRIAGLEAENARLRAELEHIRGRRRGNGKRRQAGLIRGDWQPFTGTGPLRDHIRAVMAATGIAPNSFGTVSGVSPATIARIMNGTGGRARTGLADRILAVTPATVLGSAGNARVDATGTRRRLRALAAEGWCTRQLARRAGCAGYASLAEIISGRKTRVRASTHKSVADLYDALDGTPAPTGTREDRISATKAAERAASGGWAPRAAWDKAGINDPAAGPCWERVRAGRGSRSAADLAEDIRDLLALGEHEELVAQRLGVTRKRMNEVLRRNPARGEDEPASAPREAA